MLINFNEPAGLKPEQSGGKGASLARLTSAGFNVPEGFIIPADFYDQWLSQADGLKNFLTDLPDDDPAALASACDRLRKYLAELPFPENLTKELLERLKLEEVSHTWAVRSSATTEDLAQAAFAGQHATFLNCPNDDVPLKVRDCWLSLWTERAVDYRRRAGFGLTEASMAVVVQRLVKSDVAGVGFSLDPVSGSSDQLVFDANYGLGESVVSGEVEVDHYRVSRGDGKNLTISERRIGLKQKMISPEKMSKTSDNDFSGEDHNWLLVPEKLRSQAALNDGQLEQLAHLLIEAENFYGHPVDIEWALSEGRFYLLQARPITRIPPRWTRDESAERFPNAVTPLTWDFVGKGFHLSLNHSLALMGLPPYQDQWFALFVNYIYGNQNAVEIYAERLPFSFSTLAGFEEKIPELIERFSWVWDLPVAWARNLDRYLMRLGRLDSRIDGAETFEDLWVLVRELQKVGEDYFLPNIAISITQRTLHRLVFLLLNGLAGPDEAPRYMDAVMAGCETKTGAVNRELLDLAAHIRRYPALMESLKKSSSAFMAQGGFKQWPDLARQFELFLEDHGHREVDYDPYIATWSAAPENVLKLLNAMLSRPEDSFVRPQPRIISSRVEEELLELAPEGLKVALRELIRLTRNYTALDDLEHYQTTRLYIPFRKLMVKIGGKLRAEGAAIEEDSDIFFCRMEPLGKAMETGRIEELAAIINTEKSAYLKNRVNSPRWNLQDDETFADETQTVLKGIPGSPGQAEGEVFIVNSPEDFGEFPQGAVLVARTTNPAWTPLFYKASAVITESGGPLSHGAVTAREMGLPAVMAVRDLLRRVTNGQNVRVHGREGVVEIL